MSIQYGWMDPIPTTTITGASGSGWTDHLVGDSAEYDCVVGGRYLLYGTQNFWQSQNANYLVTGVQVFDSNGGKITGNSFRTPANTYCGASYVDTFTATTNKMTIRRVVSVYQGTTYKFAASGLAIRLLRIG